MPNRFFKKKRVTAFIVLPLLIAFIAYFIAGGLLVSAFKPMFSVLGLLYGDKGYTSQQSLYSPASRTDGEIPISQITYPDYETHYAKIKLPNTKKDEDVYYGDSEAVLKKGIGQYNGSALPGYGSPILLAGHNNTYFNALKNIKKGQIITITTYYGVYTYKVTSTAVKKRNDSTAYDLLQEKEQLILYTCYPFDTLGLTENRFYVYADKVSGPNIVDK